MRLRIAVVNRHPDDALGGSELQCDLFARGLVDRGHEVTYVALHADAAAVLEPPTADRPYAVAPLDRAATADPGRIIAEVRRSGAQVVYWRYGREHLDVVAGGLATRVEPIPVVLAVAHVDDVSRWPSLPLSRGGLRDRAADLRRRLAHRRSWRAFRHIAAIAAQREDFLDRAPGVLQRHVPNVVDPAVDPFTWPRPYVAWVANLKARKRPEQIAPLAQRLEAHGIDLLVAGAVQDPRYASFANLDRAIPNLHPLGQLGPAQAAGLIAGARCLAVTARPEGLSNAMIQAWWHGVPTVSLDYDPDGAIAGLGLGAVCGGDSEAFRDQVVAHATDAGLASEAGTRAREHARERFDRAANVVRLEELLRSACGG